MKTCKKIAALLLSLVMCMSLCVAAFADTTYTITVKNAVVGETYKAYQVFAGTLSEDGKTLSDVTWGSGVDAEALMAALKQTEAFADCNSAADVAAALTSENLSVFTALVGANLSDTVAKEAEAEDDGEETGTVEVELKVSAVGYYYVTTSLGSIVSVGLNSSSVIAEKNAQPTVTKTVKEDSTGTYGESNTAGIGETVEFKSVISISTNDLTTVSSLVYHDTLSEGLTLTGTVSCSYTGVKGTDWYTVTTTGLEDGCTFEITFDLSKLENVDSITIQYSAVVNSDAEIGSEGNDNTASISYGDSQTSEKVSTKTYVYEFELAKVDESNKELDGATFTLAEGTTTYSFLKSTDSEGNVTYTVCSSETEGATQNIEVGTATIVGLDAGTYTLTETVTPDGYNSLSGAVTVTIDQEGNVSVGSGSEASATTGTVTVVNQSGSTLPGTGGMGTTIFYVVGCIMMAGAAVLLITKKRMGN